MSLVETSPLPAMKSLGGLVPSTPAPHLQCKVNNNLTLINEKMYANHSEPVEVVYKC